MARKDDKAGGGSKEDEDEATVLPLFETKEARFRGAYRVFASTVAVGICLIWIYRLSHLPRAHYHQGRLAWVGLFVADLLFGLIWIFTQSVRCNVVYRYPFKERLSHRLPLSLSHELHSKRQQGFGFDVVLNGGIYIYLYMSQKF